MTSWSVVVRRQSWFVVTGAALFLNDARHQTTAATLPPITAVAFAPNGNVVVVGSQAGVEVRAWPGLQKTATLSTELTNIHDLAFSPDGKTLGVAGGQPGAEGIVELYRWPDRELLHRITAHDDVIYAVAWSSDGKQLALASGDQRVGLLTVAEESVPPRYLDGHSRAVLAVAHLSHDNTLLSGGVDASIRWWDLDVGSTRRTLANHTRAVNDLKVRPSRGAQVLPLVASAGDDRTVRFWQPTIGRLVRFSRLDSAALALAWSPDGQILWAACRDGHVREIDPESAAVTKDWTAIDGVAYALAVAPDGSLLVAGSNGQLRRIELKRF